MKAAIFDLDGTLLDSMRMWADLNRAFLAQHHLELPPDIWRKTEHLSFYENAQYYAHAFPELHMTGDEIFEIWQQAVMDAYIHDVQPKPGAVDYLHRLHQQGVPMAVATLTDRAHAEAALRTHNLLQYFAFILTVEECGVSKRQPDIYLQCASRLGAAPADTCVFEDSLYAATTAHAAGFPVIGIFDPVSSVSREALSACCVRVADDFTQL